jgi:hypothetical protein
MAVLVATPEEITQELQAILDSGLFSKSSHQAKLLDYLCRKALRGEFDQIKESTIAVEVYGRTYDIVERQDSIVRVQAHRLRKKLAQYYESTGRSHRLRIEIRAGQYIPEFIVQQPVAEPVETVKTVDPPVEMQRAKRRDFRLWAALAVVAVIAVFLAVVGVRATGAQKSRIEPTTESRAVPRADAVRELRILAGHRDTNYVSRFGHTWAPDQFANGGEEKPGPKLLPRDTADPGIFQSMRQGDFSYDIPVAPGVYELRLFFAEPTYREAVDSEGENERRFEVLLNGKALLTSFDVVSDSGIAPNRTASSTCGFAHSEALHS